MFTKQIKSSSNSFFMNLALMQAHKSLGNTKNNPAVGCVIINNNSVISVGNTGFNGRPHAEQNAILLSKSSVKGSSLYVTLEPCSHYGKTPPCVRLIVKHKIKKVFFSLKDPDPRSYNKSTLHFKKKKIATKYGILCRANKTFYKSYIKQKNFLLPYVTGKIAISKDFFTTNKKSNWITNELSRARVHLLRSNHDCILTSSKTVIEDNPMLNCRIEGLKSYSPTRIILDKNLKIPLKSKIVNSAQEFKTIIFFNKTNNKKINLLKKLKVKMVKNKLEPNGYFNLRDVVLKIKKMGFSRIFLETGVNLTSNFLKDNLIDDFKLFVSSKKLGKKGDNKFKREIQLFLDKKMNYEEKINLLGDKLISYRIK